MALVQRLGVQRQVMPVVNATRLTAKRQRRHRVIIENVAQEQKKLRTVISFRAEPPPGYTFIPAGNPDLTNAMKEFARQGSYQIYSVTTTPHAKVHDLSKEVHRIGFHFPSAVVAQVCAHYGIVLSSAGTLVTDDDAENFRQRRQKGKNGNKDDDLDQVTINTNAKGAIKDLFPKIPDDDLHTIIKTAFQKGGRKVGTANELPLVRRAQLSVVAHIRHLYTTYDRLLRTVGYHDARGKVEGPTLKKLIEWRGDDDNGKQVLEDVIREVIVLSDDEGSDDYMEDAQELNQRDMSVEILPANGPRRTQYQHPNNDRPLSPHRIDSDYYSADEAPSGYRFVAQAPRRRRVLDLPASSAAASSQTRYAAWDRAREQYRAEPQQFLAPRKELSRYEPDHYHAQPEFNFNDPLPKSHYNGSHPQRVPDANRAQEYEGQYERQRTPPTRFRGADGVLYERIYTPRTQPIKSPRVRNGHQGHVSFQPYSPRDSTQFETQNHRAPDDDISVLPSIEDSSPAVARTAVRDSRPLPIDHRRTEAELNRHEPLPQSSLRSQKVDVIDLTDSSGQYHVKRRKVDEFDQPQQSVTRFDGPSHLSSQTRIRGGYEVLRDEYPPSEHRQYDTEIIDLSRRVPYDTAVQNRRGHDSDIAFERSAQSTRFVSPPRYSRDHDAQPNGEASRGVRARDDRYSHIGTFDPIPREYGSIREGPRPPVVYQIDAEYRPEDPVIRREDVISRRIVSAPYRDVREPQRIPTVRVPAYDDSNNSHQREYIPVNTVNSTSHPRQFSNSQYSVYPSVSHTPQGTIMGHPEPNGQAIDRRYERVPPPNYVRN